MTKLKKRAMLTIQIFCLLSAILFAPFLAFTASAAIVSTGPGAIGSGGSNGYIACPNGNARQYCMALKCTGSQVRECLISNRTKATCNDSKYNLNTAQTTACMNGIYVCMCMTQEQLPPPIKTCKTVSDCPMCSNGTASCTNGSCGCSTTAVTSPCSGTPPTNCSSSQTPTCVAIGTNYNWQCLSNSCVSSHGAAGSSTVTCAANTVPICTGTATNPSYTCAPLACPPNMPGNLNCPAGQNPACVTANGMLPTWTCAPNTCVGPNWPPTITCGGNTEFVCTGTSSNPSYTCAAASKAFQAPPPIMTAPASKAAPK